MASAVKRALVVVILGVAVALTGYMTTTVAVAQPVAAAKAVTSGGHCPASNPYCGHHKPPHHKPPHHKQCKPYRHGHCKKPHC